MEEEVEIPETCHPGIREHFIRAVLFNNQGMEIAHPANKFRVLIAAIYSCRAMVELMLEQADRGQLTVTRGELKERLVLLLPYFNLIERIRVHDFHRYGLIPPDPRLKMVVSRGPIKLTASQGAAVWQYTAEGPKSTVSGKSSVKGQRPLHNIDGNFFDEDTGQHIDINTIIASHLKSMPAAVIEFEKLLTDEGRNAHPTPELFPHMYGGEC
jgi:hypothetical protein